MISMRGLILVWARLYRKRSADLVDAALTSGQPLDPQAIQLAEQAIEAYQKVLELKPDDQQYGNPC